MLRSGDNGAGKTALLEAIMLTLGASPEVATRLRQWRGFDFAFNGPAKQVEEAIWGDLFYGQNLKSTIDIKLSGDGEEKRSLKIAREAMKVWLPTQQNAKGFRPGHGLVPKMS
jgi:recombinational DNA repair ATPase RecF